MDRRQYLGSLAVLASLTLSGCGSDGASADTTTETTTTETTTTETTTTETTTTETTTTTAEPTTTETTTEPTPTTTTTPTETTTTRTTTTTTTPTPTTTTETPAPPTELSGEGSTVTDKQSLREGFTSVTLSHDGESNFIVKLVNADTGDEQYLVNAIGAYGGELAFHVDGGNYVFDVNADGEWSITYQRHVFTEDDVRELPVERSGEGTTWFGPIHFPGVTKLTASHDGESNFIITLLDHTGEMAGLPVNEIGETEVETTINDEGDGVLQVEADGEWEVSLSEI